ncbi:nuclear transport factor 2 family protein [Microtetraspora malaysiensis]|uniref:nuclear transport factor 2 family protein n=1 Tax=Microtetraspora malaysiensis TaxID=161358 RepID=UPI003D8E1D84
MTTDMNAGRIEQLERKLAEWEDRECIRDVLYRYARAADRCDLELFKSCYHPDAIDIHWFFNGNAHEFAEYVVPLLADISNSQHSITNPIIKLDGDRAFVESQWYVLHHIPMEDGSGDFIDQQLEGRYVDVFEKRDGQWRILRRQTVVESGREFVVPQSTDVPKDHVSVGQRAPRDLVYSGMAILDVPIIPINGADLWGAARARHAHATGQ